MSTPTETKTAVFATCKLCGFKVSLSGGVAIIGENEQQRLARQYQSFGKHLQSKHAGDPRFAALMAPPGELATLALLSAFETQDLELLKVQDQIRWKIHQITRKVMVSDETIKCQVDEIGAVIGLEKPGDYDFIRAAFRNMRDALMEKDLYPELIQQPVAPGNGQLS